MREAPDRGRYCKTCNRERQAAWREAQRGGYTLPRRKRTWAEVRDMLELHSAVYGPARAVLEATRDLGMTEGAMSLQLKRNGWNVPCP